MDKPTGINQEFIDNNGMQEDLAEIRAIDITDTIELPLPLNPLWYRDGGNNLPSNKEIGLNNIIIFEPTDKQYEEGIVCIAIAKMVGVDIRCVISQSKYAPALELYTCSNVLMHKEVSAQILRYIETQVDVVGLEDEQS